MGAGRCAPGRPCSTAARAGGVNTTTNNNNTSNEKKGGETAQGRIATGVSGRPTVYEGDGAVEQRRQSIAGEKDEL